jgi:hypothetical protein
MSKKLSQFVHQLFQCVVGSVGLRFFHFVLVKLCLEIALQNYGLLGMLCSSATLLGMLCSSATLGLWGWHTAGLWKTVVGT